MANKQYKFLSESDIEILKRDHVLPVKNGKLDKAAQLEELEQIDEFYPHIEITINGKKSTINKAREVLGQNEFLSGLDRAVFHWTSSRQGLSGESVSFDASKYWNKILKETKIR